MLRFYQLCLFLVEITIWRLGSYWDISNWKLFASIFWIRRWIFPQRTRSYSLGSCYAPSSCFWEQHTQLYCSFILFLCQTYVVILSKLFLFETENFFLWSCIAYFRFLCNMIILLCWFIHCLLIIILSWSTTMHYIYHDCWTCVQEELYLPVAVILNFLFYSALSYTPNLSWVWEHLLWWIRIDGPYYS